MRSDAQEPGLAGKTIVLLPFMSKHLASTSRVILGRLRMRDAGDILLDDRSLIQILGNIVRRGADQLDAALIGRL